MGCVADRRVRTRHGLVDVDVLVLAEGYVAQVSPGHDLSVRQVVDGAIAQTADEAVARLVAALDLGRGVIKRSKHR